MSSIKINRFGTKKPVFYDMVLTYVEQKHHDDLQSIELKIITEEELTTRSAELFDILTKSILESNKPRFVILVDSLKRLERIVC